MSDNTGLKKQAREWASIHGGTVSRDMVFGVVDALETSDGANQQLRIVNRTLEKQLAAAQAVIAEAHRATAPLSGETSYVDAYYRVASILAQSPTDALQAVKAAAWDEGNAVSSSALPRCPACDDRPVSMHRRGGLNEWRHDDDGTVICGGSFTEAIRVDLNPYRAASPIPGNPEPTKGENRG